MDILCLMGLFPNEYRETIEKDSKGNPQYAADKLQWHLVNGLDEIEGIELRIVNSLYIGSYPKRYKRLMIPTFPFRHSESAKQDINVGFCNLTGLKMISRYFTARRAVARWAREESKEPKILMSYALTTPFCQIVAYIKRKFPHVKACVVVPDLPEFMNTAAMQEKPVYRFLKKIQVKALHRAIRRVDGYVLLTDAMKTWFKKPITYTVVEGIASGKKNDVPQAPVARSKTILYAGGIKREYGVVDLAEAFVKADRPDWELVIYGNGSAMPDLEALAQEHSNIVLKGSRPNAEVVAHQKQVAVLVNPRKNQEFTKYSFPSKILEYMSSGTPVLAYKLDGIPAEYDDYFFSIPDEENGFTRALQGVMDMTDAQREEMGQKAKRFVDEQKNPKAQCEKIVDLFAKM